MSAPSIALQGAVPEQREVLHFPPDGLFFAGGLRRLLPGADLCGHCYRAEDDPASGNQQHLGAHRRPTWRISVRPSMCLEKASVTASICRSLR